MNSWLSIPVILLLLISGTQCAKILAVFPMGARSHHILGSTLLRGLAEKGHDVTMISPFSEKTPPKNGFYRDIVLTGFKEEHENQLKTLNLFDMGEANILLMIPILSKMMIDLAERTLSQPDVQKLIHSGEKFDVVIVEQFMNEAHKGFAKHFNAPLVLFSTIGASSWVNPLVGNPTMLSYASEPSQAFGSNMTLYERYINAFTYSYCQLINHLYVFPQQDKLLKKYFPNKMDLADVMYSASS
ncbi:UDP-glucosyltransferase 2-like [Zophobas morio]|uniref:UDP-glucosyltransferase 2-like n=1 Tax=Zophobas morio TaxID=2755281 RepID=UPI0030832F0E